MQIYTERYRRIGWLVRMSLELPQGDPVRAGYEDCVNVLLAALDALRSRDSIARVLRAVDLPS